MEWILLNLHRSLAEHSKQKGVSMNQYCVYLLSKNDEQEMNCYSHCKAEDSLRQR